MPQSRNAVKQGKQFTFERERETKGAVRFKEVTDSEDGSGYAIGSLYLRKEFDSELGSPGSLKVTVTAT